MDNQFLPKDELIYNLWAEYEKSPEYRSGYKQSISKEHPIIIRREERGLREVFNALQKDLTNRHVIYKELLCKRKPSEWISEWSSWHKLLFKYVLKHSGRYREIEVRFGSPGDEELHAIPPAHLIGDRLAKLADDISYRLGRADKEEEIIESMASIHYHFIAIHPFSDGNGRIGRLLIDQLALAYGLPMVMGGYPRNNTVQRRLYHEAITDCAYDYRCTKLAKWIEEKIRAKIKQIS